MVVVIEVAAGEDVEAQFRVNDDGMIQYSEDGGKTWIDVIDKDELKGETGPAGPQGETGPAGPQGPAGESGTNEGGNEGGCGGNIAGTVAIVGGLLILSLAAFIVLRKKEK